MPVRRLNICEALTIHHVHELAPELIAAACSGDSLKIDLSGVERIDSAGLQLLALLQREAGECQTRLEFENPSAAVTDLAGFYRLHSVLAGTTGPLRS